MNLLNGSGPIVKADYSLEYDEDDGLTILTLRRASRSPSAAEMREVEVLSGEPIRTVTTDLALAQQMVVWLFLRRRGIECSWPDAAEVVLETEEDETPADPTVAASSGTSPPSSDTGA